MGLKKIVRNEIVKNVLTLFSGSSLAQLIPFLIYPVLSRLYTPAEFGTLALFANLMMILSIFATAKYEQAIMLPVKNSSAINITGFCLLLITGFWIFTMLVFLFFGCNIVSLFGDSGLYPWIYLLPFSVAFHSVFQVMTLILNRQKHFRSMALSRVLQSLSSSGVKLGGGFLQVGRGGLIVGTTIGHFFSAAFLFIRFYINNKNWLSLISLKRMREQIIRYIYFPKYVMLHALSSTVSAALPIIFFTRFFSSEEAGLYAMGYSIVFIPLSLFSAAIEQVLYQDLSMKFNSEKELTPLMKDTAKTIIFIAIIPFLLLFAFAPFAFEFLLGGDWAVSGVYVRIILPWLFMAFLTSPLSFIPKIFGRQKKAMFIELISFVFRVAALSAGIYYNSLQTGLILYVLVSFIMVSYSLFWYFRLANNHDKEINL